MRIRLTERKASRGIQAQLEEMERMLSAMDDKDLEEEAADLADEEYDIASEEMEGQNGKDMDNWTTEARQAFASSLLVLASKIIED